MERWKPKTAVLNGTMEDQDKVVFIYHGGEHKPNGSSEVEVDPTLASIDERAFQYWNTLKSITIPPTVTTIGNRAFYGCTSLATLNIPPNITSIGENAFSHCKRLTTLTLPPGITSFGYGTFSYCSSLRTVDLRSPSLMSVGLGTFQFCTSLVSVRFESDPIYLTLGAFLECENLTAVDAPSFSTTTFYEDREGFREVLIGAGYSFVDNSLYEFLKSINSVTDDVVHTRDMYCNTGLWARTRSVKDDGRLPLCSAAMRSNDWAVVRRVFDLNMPAVQEVDGITGLPPFMLAASDLESAYNLLREYPPAISLYGN